MKAIVLAAGLSRRMGRQKLLMPLGNGTMIERTFCAVTGASFDETILVASREIAAFLDADKTTKKFPNLRIVINEHPEDGQSSSLRLGVAALGEACDFCVMLGDLPFVTSDEIEKHKKFFANLTGGHTALVPKRGDATGHPSFFSSVWAERFLTSEGDAGGRSAIRAFSDEVAWTDGEESFFRDVDTPRDYSEILHNIDS